VTLGIFFCDNFLCLAVKQAVPNYSHTVSLSQKKQLDSNISVSLKVGWCNCYPVYSVSVATARPMGMGLPRPSWVWLKRLKTGVGRFQLSIHKWGPAPTLNCERGTAEQTADHIILTCPTHRTHTGTHDLTVLDDDTRCWLNAITASI